jgi:hypothetical protein
MDRGGGQAGYRQGFISTSDAPLMGTGTLPRRTIGRWLASPCPLARIAPRLARLFYRFANASRCAPRRAAKGQGGEDPTPAKTATGNQTNSQFA